MLRIATIGTSPITSDFIEAVAASPDAVFVGTLSRDAARARAFTAERAGTLPFTELEALAASDAVDAVYIGSPNALHAPQALACIAGGKHVLVEKSFASNEREARAVFDAAERAGVVALEAMRPLHDPAFVACRDAVAEVGRVRRASLHLGSYSSRYDELKAGRHTNIFDCAMASGALMDMGVYTVEPLIEFFGAPESITAVPVLLDEGTRGLTNGALDGAGTIVARYADHVASLHWSKISNDELPSQVEGENATLTFAGTSEPAWLRIRYRGTVQRSSAKQARTAGAPHIEERDLEPVENSMVFELADFVTAVNATRSGTPALDAPAGALGCVRHFRDVTLASLALMDEARRQMGVRFPADEA
ncbi:Gfo/Idh/MocA family protein [[Collinsella] massiliensis]|uniref:Oxidoreductase n=1 Tax=[Collinsella] massiliensis TaxID=1232426 RepID=A0A1Y3XT51_9ACTN|nr:Gfo/Idh/MocA family oxidoreductase [[Collinsella] massiliensis]OUN88683.1 oxidoreductase [[Collinsella] massiliensis]